MWSGVARVLSPPGRFGEEAAEDLLREWRMGHLLIWPGRAKTRLDDGKTWLLAAPKNS